MSATPTASLPEELAYLQPGEEVDLTNCDREPVHLIDRVQADTWTYLLRGQGTDPSTLIPIGVSRNATALFGVDPQSCLDSPPEQLLGGDLWGSAQRVFEHRIQSAEELTGLSLPHCAERKLEVSIHRSHDDLVLVFMADAPECPALTNELASVHLDSESSTEFAVRAAALLKRNLGCDRVLLNRFDEAFNGEVIVDSDHGGDFSYQGMWFPHGDIPLAARRVMAKRPLAMYGDHLAEPVDMLIRQPTDAPPPDFGLCINRTPSIMCSKYYQNIGVRASACSSLISGGRLWGFFGLWSLTPWRMGGSLRRELRAFCRDFMECYQKLVEAEGHRAIASISARQDELLRLMGASASYEEAVQCLSGLSDVIPSSGAAFVLSERVVASGETPDDEFIRSLARWLQARGEEFLRHRNLASVFKPAAEHLEKASGILALKLGSFSVSYVIWFRGDMSREVSWAGYPQKAIDPLDPEQRLQPRGSFSVWLESLKGHSSPWADHELNLAKSIRDQILVVIYELLNRELRANSTARNLESIGQLASGIAHEINTPTQYVGDNTQFLKQSFEDIVPLLAKAEAVATAVSNGEHPVELAREVAAGLAECDAEFLAEEIPSSIAQSLGGIARIRKIVQSMKEFSHPNAEEMKALDLNRAIESTITVASNEWKYVADMKTDFEADLPSVRCVPGEINQVVLNLIVNAAHAVGDVHEGEGTKGLITVSTRHDAGWVEIRIADTGTGIPLEARERLYDPFYTTKEIGRGTGQGLSIAHRVISQHSGTLNFETELGKGTTFIVRLPVGDAGHSAGTGE